MKDKERPSTTTLRTRRAVLRRRRRERQILIFGAIFVAIGATAFSAYSIYSGKTVGPFSAPFITGAGDFMSDVKLPCPPADVPLVPDQVIIRVLNSTDVAGLAGATMSDLEGRGFVNAGTGNFKKFKYEGTVRLSFGEDGVHAAYTVARHFVNPELVLDTREGTSVDIVLGVAFEELVPQYSAELAPDLILSAPKQCLPAALIEGEPAPQNYPRPEPSTSPSSSVSPTPDAGDPDDPGGD